METFVNFFLAVFYVVFNIFLIWMFLGVIFGIFFEVDEDNSNSNVIVEKIKNSDSEFGANFIEKGWIVIRPFSMDKIKKEIHFGIKDKLKVKLQEVYNHTFFQFIIFVMIIFIIRPFVPHNFFVTILSLAYLGFFIEFIISSFTEYIPEIKKFIACDMSLKRYVKNEVLEEAKKYPKVKQKFAQLGVDEAVNEEILGFVISKIVGIALFLGVYIGIFRFIVLPHLVDDYIGWNLIQLGLYPIFMIFDNFLGFHLTEWLVG